MMMRHADQAPLRHWRDCWQNPMLMLLLLLMMMMTVAHHPPPDPPSHLTATRWSAADGCLSWGRMMLLQRWLRRRTVKKRDRPLARARCIARPHLYFDHR